MELPVNIDLSTLTLDTFQSVTGHRFRMTKQQRAGGMSRDAAFAEFLAGERANRPTAPATATVATNAVAPANS